MLQFETKLWPQMKDGPPGVGTPLSGSYFNKIWTLIDTRIHGLEDRVIDWVKQTELLIEFGLQRIDTVLGPAFARVGRIATLGFLIAHSTTTETLVLDEISTFVIQDADEAELFHPSAWVTITKPDSEEDYALGRVASYVRETGILDVEIKQIVGDAGPHSDWEIATGSGVTLLVEQHVMDAQSARDGAISAMKRAIAAERQLGSQVHLAGIKARRANAAATTAVEAASAAFGFAGAAEGFKTQAQEAAASVDAPGINARLDTVETTLLTKADTSQVTAAIAATARVTARSVYTSGF